MISLDVLLHGPLDLVHLDLLGSRPLRNQELGSRRMHEGLELFVLDQVLSLGPTTDDLSTDDQHRRPTDTGESVEESDQDVGVRPVVEVDVDRGGEDVEVVKLVSEESGVSVDVSVDEHNGVLGPKRDFHVEDLELGGSGVGIKLEHDLGIDRQGRIQRRKRVSREDSVDHAGELHLDVSPRERLDLDGGLLSSSGESSDVRGSLEHRLGSVEPLGGGSNGLLDGGGGGGGVQEGTGDGESRDEEEANVESESGAV